jgi:hypothetical protein
LAGVTAHPDGAWVTQQARNLRLMLGNQGSRRLLVVLRDRDSKFTCTFDDVFRAEGAQVLITPVQAPNANAYAERWIRTARAECLDWLLIVGRSHLEQVLRVYVEHYNSHRPHRAPRVGTAESISRSDRHQRESATCASAGPARRPAPRVPPTGCMNEFLHPTGKYHNKREFIPLAGELGLAWPDGQRPHPVIGFSEVQLTEQTVADYADTLAYLGAAIRLYRDTFRRLGLLGGQGKGQEGAASAARTSNPMQQLRSPARS